MTDRDDRNLRQARARAAQKRPLAEGPAADSLMPAPTVNVAVVFDSGFGNTMSETTTAPLQYYTGRPLSYSQYEASTANRARFGCMRSGSG